MRVRPRRLLYVAFVCALLAAAIFLRYVDPFFVRGLRLIAFDTFQRLSPDAYDPDLPVRVVDVDERSLSVIGQWPWPRTTVGNLVTALADKGAAAIAFDILFAEPDRTSLDEIAKRLPPAQASALTAAIQGQPSNDQAFAAALQSAPSVLAATVVNVVKSGVPTKAGFAVAGDDPRPFIPSFTGVSSNLALLDAAAHGIGVINWQPDRDQVVRRASLLYRVGDTFVPSLAADALRVAQDATTYVLKASNASGETAFGVATGLNHIRIGSIEIPTDGTGVVYLKFRRFNPASYIPAWKVLGGKVPEDEIRGRIVLIGTSAPGLLDLRATPLDSAVPGVEIHAQLLEHMLAGRFLSRPDYALAVEEFAAVALGILLAIALPRASAQSSVLIGLFIIAAVVLGAWAAYRYGRLLLDPSYPALALAAITAAITSYVYRQVEVQRSQIRGAFSQYLAPAVVEEIIANPERLELGGTVRELTLMFCDVRNFTSISEQMTAAELTQFINELLSPLTDTILARRGTIDKYMGDAIMAFWNAPLDEPDHAAHACRAAIEMAGQMEELNRVWEQRASVAGRPFHPVKIGIGINTGECCVGNLGSTHRFDYSAIGDEVNITSRFEGLSKIYGLTAIVGERVIAKAPAYSALEIDLVQVKGRTRAVRVYTFLDLLGSDCAGLAPLQPLHSQFLAAYRQQAWDEAERLVGECRRVGVAQLESCYLLFLSRIATLRQTPLPPNWDGAFAMTEK